MSEGLEGFNCPLLKLLVVIVDKKKGKKTCDLLKQEGVRLQYVFIGHGTANSEVMDMFGLDSTEKTIVFCVEPAFRIPTLFDAIIEKLKFYKPGSGIAFSVPLSGISSSITRVLSSEMQALKEKWVDDMENKAKEVTKETGHELIVSVINQGFSDDLMDAAKTAGATGGTVFHARRIGAEDAVKFFGISVQGEREIVAILAPHDKKRDIMKAISKNCGMHSEAKAIVFSLPVDGFIGLSNSKG